MSLIRRDLQVQIHSFWHAGTGRGEGTASNAVVARTAEGLPTLPGRTLKGLCRAATEQALSLGWYARKGGRGAVTSDDIVGWFGNELPRTTRADQGEQVAYLERPEARHRPGSASLRFYSARLGATDAEAAAWAEWAEHGDRASDKDRLFVGFASVRIASDGLAHDQALRLVELTVPLTLVAPIYGPPDGRWAEALSRALPLVRAVGSGRNRGLGRATLKLGAALGHGS